MLEKAIMDSRIAEMTAHATAAARSTTPLRRRTLRRRGR
jgi:hypothetical protein